MEFTNQQHDEWKQKLFQASHHGNVSLGMNGVFNIHGLSASEYSTVLNRLRQFSEIKELSYTKDGYDFSRYDFSYGRPMPQEKYCIRGRIELPEKTLTEDIEVHDELNPAIQNENNQLQPELREKICNIVDNFLESLTEAEIAFELKDILLVGSNCSYNYTDDSDLDIHMIFDLDAVAESESEKALYAALYSAYTTIWKKNHDVTLNSVPIELYAQTDFDEEAAEDINDEKSDTGEIVEKLLGNETIIEALLYELKEKSKLQSNGIYSVIQDEQVKFPDKDMVASYDKEKFDQLFETWEDKYLKLMSKKNISIDDIDNFIDALHKLRSQSISEEGEFGVGNLVFKEFRNKEYLKQLKDLRKILRNKDLSL